MNKSRGNIAASVCQCLLNRARKDQRPFSELFQYYALERFLYRLPNRLTPGGSSSRAL